MNRCNLGVGLILGFSMIVVPVPARGDQGEWDIGIWGMIGVPKEAGAGAALRLGCSDWIALDARVGFLSDNERGAIGLNAGLVALWDVLTWVPELRLSGGARAGTKNIEPSLEASVGLRRYLKIHWSLGLAVSGVWSPNGWHSLLTLSWWRTIM